MGAVQQYHHISPFDGGDMRNVLVTLACIQDCYCCYNMVEVMKVQINTHDSFPGLLYPLPPFCKIHGICSFS
jgi:hypothetical protein